MRRLPRLVELAPRLLSSILLLIDMDSVTAVLWSSPVAAVVRNRSLVEDNVVMRQSSCCARMALRELRKDSPSAVSTPEKQRVEQSNLLTRKEQRCMSTLLVSLDDILGLKLYRLYTVRLLL